MINTGYGKPLGNDEIYDVDWNILEKYSKIDNFFVPVTNSVLADSSFLCSEKATQKHRENKTLGTLVASKGCVARCTFAIDGIRE